MTYFALALCLPLLFFAASGALLALALKPLGRRAVSAGWSGRALFTLRCAPFLGAAGVAMLLVLPAFLRHEPRHTGERIGPLLLLLAGCAAFSVACGAVRAARALLATRRMLSRWNRGAAALALEGSPVPAYAIDEEFPLVALVGILRPRLVVARRVLGLCSPPEIAAVVAHEAAHLRSRDNLKRVLMRACPEFLPWSRTGAALEAAWEESCERAADERAAREGRRDDLAAALLKVARAAAATCPAPAPLSAFCRGDEVAVRVRRLLREEAPGRIHRRFVSGAILLPALGAASLLALGRHPGVLRDVHTLSESIVRLLQ